MLGVCYYPEHWPEAKWPEDARRMREMGVRFVRIGEFAWSRLEPAPGRFEFGWLRRAMDILAEAGLKIVLATPTAAPPKWLMDLHPDIAPVGGDGRARGFGSRRHYSFSSEEWLAQTRRIVERVAREFGEHEGLAGWQTDNEYGCHQTAQSFGAEDLRAFRGWLRSRYQTPDQLNEAWGAVFWSTEVSSYDEVNLPIAAVAETNPAAQLDFRRFSSDQIAAYNRMQTETIRRHSPGRFVTHNFMGLFHDFDHYECAAPLDFASWDSYPLGFVESFPFSPEEKTRYAETSHPDMAPFHHDLYRGVGRGRFWVMEQQPGPVNWASWNPIPRRGQIRLFTWEALAHGAEVVSYFRWRQAPFAQEQMHAGLNLPNDAGLTQGGVEASQVGAELARLGPLPATKPAPVALVFDYQAAWMLRIQPQGANFSYSALVFRWYSAVRRMGLDVDIVPPGADLRSYAFVLAPSLPYVSEDALAAFRDTNAQVLFGPRSGSKTRNFSIPDNLPPGPLAALLPIRVREVASLRPGLEKTVGGEISGRVAYWREIVEPMGAVETLAAYDDGSPALLCAGSYHYFAGWPEFPLLRQILKLLAERGGLPVADLPQHVRIRRRGDWRFAFNYGTTDFDLGALGETLLGEAILKPSEVTIWRAGP